MPDRRALHIELQSQPESIAQVETYVEQAVRSCECKVSEQIYGNILVALTEAVNNAIIHGNGCEADKIVRVAMRQKGTCLTFRIEDEGGGFNPDTVPDPTHPDNLCKIGGRGVFLMRQLSDQLRFLDEGRAVEIKFTIK